MKRRCIVLMSQSPGKNELEIISGSISGMIRTASETNQIGFKNDVKFINLLNLPNTDETDSKPKQWNDVKKRIPSCSLRILQKKFNSVFSAKIEEKSIFEQETFKNLMKLTFRLFWGSIR